MTNEEGSHVLLWEERYRELEDSFALAMLAIAEGLDRHSISMLAPGIGEIITEVAGSRGMKVVATLSGPPQEIAFRISLGGTVIMDRHFASSNTVSFVAPVVGKYEIACTSRVLGSAFVMSSKTIEVTVE